MNAQLSTIQPPDAKAPPATAIAPDASTSAPACIRPRVAGAVDDALLSALLPSYSVKTQSLKADAHGGVQDCRGDEGVLDRLSIAELSDGGVGPGAMVLTKAKLADGRLGVIVATAANGGACDSEEGFIAIVKLETKQVIVESVGPWASNCRGPYTLSEHHLGSRLVWLESEGEEGSGAGTMGHQTLYITKDALAPNGSGEGLVAKPGQLVVLGQFETGSHPDCMGTGACDSSSGRLSFEPDAVVFHEEALHQMCREPDDGGRLVCNKGTNKKTVTKYGLVNGELVVRK